MKIIRKNLNLRTFIFFTIGILITSLFFTNLITDAVEISSIEFIGQATLPKRLSFQNTQLGGLSGITYDSSNDLYYAISDDRGQKAPARFYTFKIDLSQGKLQDSSIVPVGVTTLLKENGQPFVPGETDTEGIAVTQVETVFISSEGDVDNSIYPFIKEFPLSSGKAIRSLSIPQKFLPDSKQGIRNNLAFESLTITPNNKYLFTATENALIQDGEAAQPDIGSPCRILQYNLQNNQPEKEFLYQTEPISPFLNLTGKFASGLPDLIALDNHGHFISIERSFAGLGFGVSLFQVSLSDADNIQNINSLLAIDSKNIKPVEKKLLLDLRTLDVALDNIEGLTIGPWLPNRQKALILISDNNFNSIQRNQILAFQLKIESSFIRLLRGIVQNFKL
ncbi:esterase-like activity of phytase family protein [Nostoc parmelioides]|uniref:Esterase-like activity of phytase family protein n=1 Tax=Nostoc parmelioides FACHB-3921 TaxID=2692909 RepID=A0ABR8BFL3_9NOSO|nr:esterase-like activity of phytase family protein [Nostoc parmelioides]MBD2252882.1 esterase-like activity of phytase family protein [Nostoc parmelioides FACHB-3921]